MTRTHSVIGYHGARPSFIGPRHGDELHLEPDETPRDQRGGGGAAVPPDAPARERRPDTEGHKLQERIDTLRNVTKILPKGTRLYKGLAIPQNVRNLEAYATKFAKRGSGRKPNFMTTDARVANLYASLPEYGGQEGKQAVLFTYKLADNVAALRLDGSTNDLDVQELIEAIFGDATSVEAVNFQNAFGINMSAPQHGALGDAVPELEETAYQVNGGYMAAITGNPATVLKRFSYYDDDVTLAKDTRRFINELYQECVAFNESDDDFAVEDYEFLATMAAIDIGDGMPTGYTNQWSQQHDAAKWHQEVIFFHTPPKQLLYVNSHSVVVRDELGENLMSPHAKVFNTADDNAQITPRAERSPEVYERSTRTRTRRTRARAGAE